MVHNVERSTMYKIQHENVKCKDPWTLEKLPVKSPQQKKPSMKDKPQYRRANNKMWSATVALNSQKVDLLE